MYKPRMVKQKLCDNCLVPKYIEVYRDIYIILFSLNFIAFKIITRMSQMFVGFGLLCKTSHISSSEFRSLCVSPSRHSSLCAHEANAGLTSDRGDAGGQVLLEGVLVCLRLLRLRQDVVARVGQVGDLDLLCLRHLQFIQAFRVAAFLWLHPGPDALPPPEDQRHSVTDGLGHDLEIVLVEKPRVNLQRSTHLARSWAHGWARTQAHKRYLKPLPNKENILLKQHRFI